jgi:hypothetical protein
MPSPQQIRELERKRAELAELERKRDELLGLEKRAGDISPARRYWDDFAGFVHDAILWRRDEPGPTGYQDDIMQALVRERRACARGPHGLGKTAINAWAVLWFSHTREGEDWKVVTTASAWRQLTVYLWPEIHKWARRLNPQVTGRPLLRDDVELLDLAIKLRTGQATAVASNDPEKIEGAHADHILYIFDEAKIVPGETFDAAEGALSTGEAYALAMSTPGEPSGRFYDIQRHAPGYEDWWTRHVTLEEATGAGRVSAEWAEARKRQWGEESAVYQNRVLGDFASSDEDAVIPLAWVEAANQRWLEWRESGLAIPQTCVGVDVARGGEDDTVLAHRAAHVITELEVSSKADTMVTTGRVVNALAAGGYAVVDVIGVGAGVVDRLREQGKPAIAFNAGEGTELRDSTGMLGFLNARAAAWWAMREFLDPANGSKVCLPPDDMLTGDLTAPKWWETSRGLIQIEAKKDIKSRIGRSTDRGDAVVQAFWTPPPPKVLRVVYEEPGGEISPI